MSEFTPGVRSRVRRLSRRAAYDRAVIYPILDEGMVCHVGFAPDGQPFVIPTIYAREGDTLYLHGSAASRLLRALQAGIPACVTVTLVDGLVLARSAFHHSMNYRSVVAFGTAALVTDADEKLAALRTIAEHLTPGRWREARPPTPRELAQTSVLKFAIEEASAKVRTGPPLDDEEDYALPVWAGVLPLRLMSLPPEADPKLPAGVAVPDYLAAFASEEGAG